MKKTLLLILLLISLVGCSKSKGQQLSVVSAAGAPSLAFYNHIDNPNFNTGDVASILPELKGENGSDIIVIDTVNGIKAINAGSKYKLAATITFGNFYIASTGNDDNDVMDDGDYIVVFSKDATPDLIFHYIYGDSLDSDLHYVGSVSDASTCLIKGINITDDNRKIDEDPYVDYVMIAEPALTAALSKNENVSVYANIQEEYYAKSNGLDMILASVFVSNRISEDRANEFIDKLEKNIVDLLANPDLFSQSVNELSDDEIKDIFGVPNAKIATKVLKENSIGLGFKKAYDNKQAIDKFISLFGMEETNEEIFIR